MTAGWVAGAVRAKAMARRVLGAEAARQLAGSGSLPQAQRLLMRTAFRDASEPGLSLGAAQHAVAATILWDLRVLAGWLPRDGVNLLLLLAGWFEIANVDELLQTLTGRPSRAEFELGALATAWPRLSEAGKPGGLACALAASPWGDPGGTASGTSGSACERSLRAAPRPETEPWQAEADWWRRVERDGRVLLRSSGFDSDPVLGAVAVMTADARRICAALASAARGGLAPEGYDATV